MNEKNTVVAEHLPKIIGPGSLNVDVTGYAPHLPVAGETTAGTAIRFSVGGKGNNQMTAAHRAGADAVLIGCRGDDFLGHIIEEHYKSEGMTDAHIRIDATTETGAALIEIDERDGQNRIIVVPGANAAVHEAQIMAAESDFACADVVLSQLETPVETVMAAKKLAQKHGKPFILNPAPFTVVPPELFDGVDYVTPNETEAEGFTGVKVETVEDCRRAAKRFLAMGVRHVIITLGVRGVYYFDGETELTVPALRVNAVNTTGAGDAFNGGFATALANGMDVENALKFATCTSAISVTREGAASSMPQRQEILLWLEREFGIKC